MADVRALLKQKRQEARINHPLASYNASGQLRCIVCGSLVKHASAWEGHLGSKAHRLNVAKAREEEARRLREEEEERERITRGKRKAEEVEEEDEDESATKKRKVETGFPADFFSDPSRGPIAPSFDDDADDDEGAGRTTAAPAPAPAPTSSSIDLEWERFQREIINAPDNKDVAKDAFDNATLIAEPVLVSETPQGFPPKEGALEATNEPSKVDEQEARRRKEQDDRELIMDRLLEEERAQEEADMKVVALKNKLDALRSRRAAKKG